MMTPHSPPSTRIGTPTAARRPIAREPSARAPEALAQSSIRAALPVWNTSVGTFRPPSLARSPTGKEAPVLLHAATTVLVPSGSYLAIDV